MLSTAFWGPASPVEVPYDVRPSTVLLGMGSLEAPIASYRRVAGSAEKPDEQQPPLCSLLFLPAWGSLGKEWEHPAGVVKLPS